MEAPVRTGYGELIHSNARDRRYHGRSMRRPHSPFRHQATARTALAILQPSLQVRNDEIIRVKSARTVLAGGPWPVCRSASTHQYAHEKVMNRDLCFHTDQ